MSDLVVCNYADKCLSHDECGHAKPHIKGAYASRNHDGCGWIECPMVGRKVRCIEVKKERV